MIKNPTAGIILAAGMSTRFGSPKQLLKIGDSTLLVMVIDAALKSELDRVVLVLGHRADEIKASIGSSLSGSRLKTIINPCYQEGMATSLQCALKAVRTGFPSIMVLMGDQPLLSDQVINILLRRFRGSEKDICIPVYNGKRGLPVCLTERFYDDILEIKGDIGAREIIRDNPKDVMTVEMEGANAFIDVDNEADLERINELMKDTSDNRKAE